MNPLARVCGEVWNLNPCLGSQPGKAGPTWVSSPLLTLSIGFPRRTPNTTKTWVRAGTHSFLVGREEGKTAHVGRAQARPGSTGQTPGDPTLKGSGEVR